MPVDEPALLLAREPLAGAYTLLTFRHAETAKAARAGQFVMIKAGTSPEPPLRRPFSVMSVDRTRQTFTLFLKAVGPGSRALAGLREGEVAQCLGPLGRSFPVPAAGEEALLVGGGYGIAPFRLFCEQLGGTSRARVFYGGRTGHDLQLRDRFADLGVPLQPATEDGSLGQRGRVTAPLEAYLDARPGPVRLYACGPEAMLQAVARLAGERGLQASVSLDPWMGCGLGTCLGCVVWVQAREEGRPHYRCACTEGPVFDAATVVWPGELTSLARRRPERSPA
jgi:dihydroorotate dehydrogenase electron transfer subunit